MAILEVKHPQASALTRGELAALKAALVKVLPLQSTDEQVEVHLAIGPAGAAGPAPGQRLRTVHRFASRSRTSSVSFTPDAFSLETTSYRGWSGFRDMAKLVATALKDVAPVDGIQRIGLRYIDEIRVPYAPDEVPDWREWIQADLIAPNALGLRPVQQQAVVQYGTDRPGDTVTLRYGAVIGPPAVGSGALARPPAPPSAPFFLLDTDAAWEVVPGDPIPELDVDFLIETADRLHEPVKALFEAALTPRLIAEVLNAE
jgi:uncharacterized protein (TIGR04255 family)